GQLRRADLAAADDLRREAEVGLRLADAPAGAAFRALGDEQPGRVGADVDDGDPPQVALAPRACRPDQPANDPFDRHPRMVVAALAAKGLTAGDDLESARRTGGLQLRCVVRALDPETVAAAAQPRAPRSSGTESVGEAAILLRAGVVVELHVTAPFSSVIRRV